MLLPSISVYLGTIILRVVVDPLEEKPWRSLTRNPPSSQIINFNYKMNPIFNQ